MVKAVPQRYANPWWARGHGCRGHTALSCALELLGTLSPAPLSCALEVLEPLSPVGASVTCPLVVGASVTCWGLCHLPPYQGGGYKFLVPTTPDTSLKDAQGLFVIQILTLTISASLTVRPRNGKPHTPRPPLWPHTPRALLWPPESCDGHLYSIAAV